MKAIFWNVRGIGNQDSRLALKKLVLMHHPDFLFISEPWIASCNASGFLKQLNLKLFAENDKSSQLPNFWCLCKSIYDPSIVMKSSQQVSFSFSADGQNMFMSVVYAAIDYIQRRLLWKELNDLQVSFKGLWCFIDDFNAILGAHEQRSRCLPNRLSCDDFKN